MKQQRWTDEDIVAAIQMWAEEHGAPPTSYQWKVGADECRPNATTVADHFGSWADAIERAGFERPPKVSTRKLDRRKARKLREQGLSNVQIGQALGVHSTTVGKFFGVTPRDPKKTLKNRSRERRIADLRKALEQDGGDPADMKR